MKTSLFIIVFVAMSMIGWSQGMQADEDLKKIYLYTMVIFMQDIEREYQEASTTPQAWQMLQQLHAKQIGFSSQKDDYQPQDVMLRSLIQSHFSPEQQRVLDQRHLFDINSMSGQVLYYELIYKEHPLGGGFHFLPDMSDERERLQLAFASAKMGNFMLDDQMVWGEYLSLWMLLVRMNNQRFQKMMDQHIAEYNQELQKLSKATHRVDR